MIDLVIDSLTMRFSGLVALDEVSFSVKNNEIFSLIGPNGSGKTTLFNCINGFNKPQNGKIYFNGDNLLGKKAHRIIHSGISRTFQNVQNIPFMTILDNILLGANSRIDTLGTLKRCVSRDQRKAEESMALEIMDFLGMANYEQKFMMGQPFGIQKLAEIARALVSKPKLILLDEPAAGMNDQETREIANIVSDIRDELGVTVLLVEHDMNLVMSISDRICVLESGKILALGKPSVVKDDPKVIESYLGEPVDA
ncbi:MAG: ABC transporter ATP-binding protein [Candidatus Neomarinimicrobiota bacterium]|nr:ABC transporter ATP-binding protein [Candidatus Neomarinimicrobiota bacterium]